MQAYTRYADAELRAWLENNTEKAIMLARWKARAYRMYAVSTPYF
jgi:hypothetical protein